MISLIVSQGFAINYFRCDRTEDCGKVYGGCGRYYSVHRRYVELYEAKARKGDTVSFCKPPTELDQKYKLEGRPVCVKNKCRLTLKKKPNKS